MKTKFTVKRLGNLKGRFLSIMSKNGINIIPDSFELKSESFTIKTGLKTHTEIFGVYTLIDGEYFVEINII